MALEPTAKHVALVVGYRRIAQLVERRSPKPQVVSSRLTAPVVVAAVAAVLTNSVGVREAWEYR